MSSCSARSTATILKANVKSMPKFALDYMAGHAVDWYLMCEDLPDPESRIMVDGKDIVMQWRRSNMQSHRRPDAR